MNYQNFTEQYNKAATIAQQAHENQKYGSRPYATHLVQVIEVLKRFGYQVSEADFNPLYARLQIAAWLHDILEDTVLEYKHLEYEFGGDVADLVWKVTDEPGRNRKEKKMATYPKIKSDPLAVILKLADRIANVEASIELHKEGNKNLFGMYQKEYGEFKQNLYTTEGPQAMWQRLDELLLK